MICTLFQGALLVAAASQVDRLELEPGPEAELLVQVGRRAAFIQQNNVEMNYYDRQVRAFIEDHRALIIDDGRFTEASNLDCGGGNE